MCGRFDLHSPPRRWASLLGARFDTGLDTCVAPSYNIAPGRAVLIAVTRDRRRSAGHRALDSAIEIDRAIEIDSAIELDSAVWGLPVPWAPHGRRPPTLHNARAETLARKSPFRHLLREGRCLVAADGFYEWRANPGSRARRAFYFSRADGQPMLMAGLRTLPEAKPARTSASWPTSPSSSQLAGTPAAELVARSTTEPAGGPPALPGCHAPTTACTVVTTPANDDVAAVHHRMPAVLDVDAARRWLGVDALGHHAPSTSMPDLAELVAPAGTLAVRAVPLLVSDPRNDGPELLEAVTSSTWEDPPRLFR